MSNAWRNRKQIKIKKERMLLSDVLPFELPITFSNRYFNNFLIKNKISSDGKVIKADHADQTVEAVMKLLLGFKNSTPYKNDQIECGPKDFTTIPFKFKIAHKEKDFRELTLIHPKNQLALVGFYEKYKELILYYCNISPFSIRHPYKVAKFSYYKDRTHIKNLAHDHEHKSVEEFDKEYENLKTFFSYKEISNVYKFYESYKYHRCEKKYNKLFKFDISRCFDSIYSHSISWALLNKEIVKHSTELLKLSNKTFGGEFDILMRNLNYGETNGIIIGPEFSRIFAEIILQKIDLDVMHHLQEKKKLKFRTDYEIFRYVDDYFVFYNEETAKDEILSTYRNQLKEYKLYVNDSKSLLLGKPIITEITVAKLKIADLLNKGLNYRISEKKLETDEVNDEKSEKRYSFYVSSHKLITRFKTIIKETKVEYKDILTYTLACVDGKALKLIKIYSKLEDKREHEHKITSAILDLLNFSFFLYCVSPKVNTTIKLCLVLSKIIKFAKIKGNFNSNNKHLIFKEIYDNIFLVLGKSKSSEHIQVETLYLLIVLKELGREYRLEESVLSKYFDINLKKKKGTYDLNYFSITVLLFYIEDIPRYRTFKEILKERIKYKFKNINKDTRLKTTELTLLLFDLISCPYLENDFKKDLLKYYDIIDPVLQGEIINIEKYWFTKWTEFDFVKELEAKKSQSVY